MRKKWLNQEETLVTLLISIILLILLSSCWKDIPDFPPTPPPTPTPTPTPPTCMSDVPWCSDLTPPATCSTPEQPCKHNPTSDPAHCELAAACPPPVPTCPEACPEGQECKDPKVGCVPKPKPPTPGVYPVRFPKPGVVIYMRNARWNRGVDSTLRSLGDKELCELLHHVPVPSGDCHFDSDMWNSTEQRGNYEALVLAGARDGEPLPPRGLCPVWEFKSGSLVGRCHDDRESVPVSCDHFGSVGAEDDPQTPGVFEGRPLVCGQQVDEFGPYAGFFMVPQCTAGQECSVRACGPMGQECAGWLRVTWRE